VKIAARTQKPLSSQESLISWHSYPTQIEWHSAAL